MTARRKERDRVLIDLSTPIHPTPRQAEQLDLWLRQTADIGAAVRASPPTDPERQLEALVAAWPEVPPPLVRQVACWAARGTAVPAGRIPLDDLVMAVSPYQVHLEGLPDLVVADVWHLPLGLTDALLADGSARVEAINAALQCAILRDGQGDPGALRAVRALAGHAAPVLGRAVRAPGTPGAQRARHATLRAYRTPEGTRGWAITWSFRVGPDWLGRAWLPDTAGVDVGVRNLLTWASRLHGGRVEGWRLMPGDWQLGPSLPAAVARHTLFARRAGALDDALRTLLAHQRLAVEATNWRGLAGTPEIDAMTASAVVDVRHWLTTLARVTGTQVVSVPPWHTSCQCSRCGRRGVRAGRRFTCVTCGDEDADVNAARYLRAQG